MTHPIVRFSHRLLKKPILVGAIVLGCSLLAFLGLPTQWIGRVLLGFITVMQGPSMGLSVLLWFLLWPLSLAFSGQWILFLYAAGMGLATYFSACLWYYYRSASLMVEVLAAFGMLLILIAHQVVKGLDQHWLKIIQRYVKETQEILQMNGIESSVSLHKIQLIAQVATGFQVSLLLLTILFTLGLAMLWQSVLKQTSLSKHLYNLHNSYAMVMLLLLTFILGIPMGWLPFRDGLIVLLLPFVLSALSAMHAVLSDKPYNTFLLVSFYVIFLFFWPYIAVALAILGLLDTWYDCRMRWKVYTKG